MPRLLVVAGEPSGDAHAARAVAALLEQAPNLAVDAVGGTALAAARATVRWPVDRLSARGFGETVAALPRHVGLYASLSRELRAGTYDAAILVDYPGFNLSIARVARSAHVPVLYYVAPQLWAWGAWRVGRLRRDVSHLAAILPFEAPFFSGHGIPTTFVGHPLLDARRPDRASARRALGLGAHSSVLGLFPGSRRDEIARHWPDFRDAARLLRAERPGLEVVVAASGAGSYPGAEEFLLHRGDPAEAFGAADAALCKSGTTTLEAALADTPMVVAYRMSRVTYALARRLIRVSHIGLSNIVAGKAIAPELIQDAVTPAALAGAVRPLLEPDGAATRAQRAELRVVRERLGLPGAAARVADLARRLVA